MKLLFTFAALLVYAGVTAQVGIGTTTPNANAVLELKSPGNNQGFLVPRLTTIQRTGLALAPKDNGLLVFDSDDQKFYYWQNTQWLPIKSGNDVNLIAGAGIDITGNTISAVPDADGDASNEIQDLQLTGNMLTITNNDNATPIDLSPFADADGDPTNEIQDLQLVGNTLSITNNAGATSIDLAPFAGTNTDNQTLSFNTNTGALDITGGNSVTLNATGAAGGILSGTYPNPGLIDNVITSAKIVDGTIATNDLANLSVTTAKLGDVAVTTGKVADNAVTNAKIADATISSAKLTTTGVTANTYGTATVVPRITVDAAGRVTGVSNVTISGVAPAGTAGGDLSGTYPSPSIVATAGNNILNAVNNAATSATLAVGRLPGSVVLDTEGPVGGVISGNFGTGLQINNDAISSAKILDGTIASTDISDGTIVSGDIADGTIAAADIANGAITGVKLENTTVTPGLYGAATTVPQFNVDAHGRVTSVTPVTIAGVAPGGAAAGDLAGTYPSPSIAAAAGNNIVSALNNAATTTTIATGKLAGAVVLDSESPTGGVISGSFGGGLQVNDNAITSIKIADGTIAAGDLANSAVTTTKIADGAITGVKLENVVASPGSFGTATAVPQLNVDVYGRVTSVVSVPISGVAPGGAAGGLLSGTYPNPGINTSMGNALVTTLNDAATNTTIATGKLASSVVLDSESPTGGVISGTFGGGLQINDNSITSAKIVDGTIASTDIADGSVVSTDIADGTILSGDIADGTIATADVADAAVTTVKLNNLAVTTAKLADAAVTNAKISGVDPSKITPSGVLGQVLTTTAVGTVWTNLPSLGGGTVTSVGTGTGLTGGPITGTGTISIANGGVTTTQIADGTITNGDLSAGAAISVSKLAPGGIDGQVLTTSGGVPTWSAVPSSNPGLDKVLSTGNDAKDQDAKGFNSITITNAGGDKIIGSGALNVQGAHFMSFTEIVADYSVQPNDYIILCNPSKLVGVTLPKAGENKGRILMFQSTGTSSTQAMVLKSDDNIDGQPNSEILWIDPNFSNNTAYAVTVMSTGTTWVTISRSLGRSKG